MEQSAQPSSCSPCPVGTANVQILAAPNASACVRCPSPSYAASPSLCLKAPAGQAPNLAGDAADPCAAGTYRSDNMTACAQCAPGSRSAAGAVTCVGCLFGTYSAAMGTATCTSCSSGYVAALSGIP